MSVGILFLSLQDILDIHRDTIEHEGGGPGVRDVALVESAVAMPQQAIAGTYLHHDLAAMAAAYLFHLVSNHGFVDGNKRVGLSAAMIFLLANGVESLPGAQALERVTFSVASGEMGKEELTTWLRGAMDSGA